VLDFWCVKAKFLQLGIVINLNKTIYVKDKLYRISCIQMLATLGVKSELINYC